mmetsp:Transcript_28537/g.13191  ORF Transcript_28537/g.13191 Transcript_28537/m.13191 type:complete len:110 (+) Transcript_28537:1242-1571(+)
MVADKCENLHGHNWKIEVCVISKKLNKQSIVMDFGEIKKHVRKLMEKLDHKFLNELEFFDEKSPPTSENVAVYIATELQKLLKYIPDVMISKVTAWESDDAAATYYMKY